MIPMMEPETAAFTETNARQYIEPGTIRRARPIVAVHSDEGLTYLAEVTVSAPAPNAALSRFEGRSILDPEPFAHIMGMAPARGAVLAVAEEFFGTGSVREKVISDPDLGGELLRVDVVATGMATQELISRRRKLDAAIEKLEVPQLERILVNVRRG